MGDKSTPRHCAKTRWRAEIFLAAGIWDKMFGRFRGESKRTGYKTPAEPPDCRGGIPAERGKLKNEKCGFLPKAATQAAGDFESFSDCQA